MSPPASLLDALRQLDGGRALAALDTAGELTRHIPELELGRGFRQPDLHYYTVLDHNLAAVAALDGVLGPGEDGIELRRAVDWVDLDGSLERAIEGLPLLALLRLACLVHDVAKPETATMADDRLRFPHHGPRGAELMAARLPALGFGEDASRLVAAMVRYHLRPGVLVQSWPPTDRALRKFVADVDGHVLPLLLLNLADGMATRGPGYTRANFRRHIDFLSYVLARSVGVAGEGEEPLLGGDETMAELGLQSGRLLGAVLTSVRRAQDEGTIANRDEALALARATLAELRSEA